MKYNRAFIIRNEKSIPILENVPRDDITTAWLFESGESFHGEHDDTNFYFKDSRFPDFRLPIDCVELEFGDNEN